MLQPVAEHVRLQRVERRRQPLHELPHALQLGGARRRIELPREIRIGLQPGQVGGDEARILQQAGPQPQALLELGAPQLAVDRQ